MLEDGRTETPIEPGLLMVEERSDDYYVFSFVNSTPHSFRVNVSLVACQNASVEGGATKRQKTTQQSVGDDDGGAPTPAYLRAPGDFGALFDAPAPVVPAVPPFALAIFFCCEGRFNSDSSEVETLSSSPKMYAKG